jgi:protein-S-isoprenylcysteine O-methyltransferase Ste14
MIWNAVKSVVFASGFVTVFAWLALRLRRLDVAALPEWVVLPGVALVLLGAPLGLWCVATFVVRGRGTPALFDPPVEFVATGPYRRVRNPMYIGGLSALMGAALWLRSPAMLIFSIGWWLAAHLLVVVYEEPHLRRRFGEPYRRYCRTVSRWLPGLSPSADRATIADE